MRKYIVQSAPHYRVRHENGMLAVDQGEENGYQISYNPDDNRYYIHDSNDVTVATFKSWRNAVQFCRKPAKYEDFSK